MMLEDWWMAEWIFCAPHQDTGDAARNFAHAILKANHLASSEREVRRKADLILAQCDKDGDGVVDYDEFVVVSRKFPNILFPSHQ